MRKVYSKKGDLGVTQDFSGKNLPKDHVKIITAGKIDSVQSAIDRALLHVQGEEKRVLEWVQRKLWQSSGELSGCSGECITEPVTEKDVADVEKCIDRLGEPPSKFVRFNTEEAIVMNECRVRCRELETFLVQWLRKKKLRPVLFQFVNRLSSLFFMLAYTKGKKDY